jgi:hypothetical protein
MLLERERYVEKVEKVVIDGKEITVTHTRPVLTPEELLQEQIRAKKILVSILKNHYEAKEKVNA